MARKYLTLGALALSVALMPGTAVFAGGSDIVGGIIGGVIGGAIVNEANKNRRTTTRTVTKKPAVSSYQREQNREVQTALNYFGYPVGTPDGVIGAKSRAAISQYQMLLGYPATGQITEVERQILVTSYQRAMIGGPQVQQAVSGPQGMRGLLLAQRDQMYGTAGGAPTMAGQQGMPMPQQAPGTMVMQPGMPMAVPGMVGGAAGTMVMQPTAPTPAMPGFGAQMAAQPVAPTPAMPSFGAGMVPQPVTAKAYCTQVQAKTGANGGLQKVAMMSDPAQALGEQFCQVSAEAREQGTALVAQIQGFTPAQISEQCRGFGALLADQVALLTTTPRDDMIASIQGFLAQSGMDEAQTAGTARVCLAMGYADDEMPVALGSALVLAGTGNMVYAEFIGHHLAAGVGTEKHPDLALDWYELGLNALSIGQTPVFAAGQPDRAALIHKAAFALNGRSDAPPAAPTPVAAPSPGLAGFGAAAAKLLQTGGQGSQP